MLHLRWIEYVLHCLAALLLIQVGCREDTPNGCSNSTAGECSAAVGSDSQLAEVSLLQTIMHVQKERPKRSWKLREGARLNEVLVVPSLKLIFCFIPKNACTQFNRLMNALNDVKHNGEICSKDDPNYRSSMHGKFTRKDLEHALNSDDWTKATFLRDPLERFVSAYLSKCVAPRECGGCMHTEMGGNPRPKVSEVTSRLKFTDNVHFTTQGSFCGGLADNIGAYDYVGHISDDTEAVAAQVAEMLSLAVHRSSKAAVVSDKGKASNHSATVVQTNSSVAIAEVPLAHFGRKIGKKEAEVLELGRRFFPVTGLKSNDPHSHPGTNVSSFYQEGFALMQALEAYADDYDQLPGLKLPDWAHKVHRLYDAMPWRRRPKGV